MKKVCMLLSAGLFLFATGHLFAQKLVSGSFDALKGQKTVNIQYDYSKMAVGKFSNEQDYINKRTADMNKKEAGTGDTWAKAWIADRDNRFHPMFEKNLNGKLAEYGVTCGQNAKDATYTFVFHVLFTEPGFIVGVTRQNAFINVVVDVVETANPGTVLGSMSMNKVQSVYMGGYDFDTGTRIQSCYDRAGDWLGSFLIKNVLK